MVRGLEGRRIAVFASADEPRASTVVTELEKVGARLQVLKLGEGRGDEWHGGRYAALVLVGDSMVSDPKVIQLVREMFVSEKPVAAFGDSATELAKSGGADAELTASGSSDIAEFARRVVAEFSNRLEEQELDAMSDLSFPASDPPAVTPTKVGRVPPDSDARS